MHHLSFARPFPRVPEASEFDGPDIDVQDVLETIAYLDRELNHRILNTAR